MIKILHTADWHLGKKLDSFSRLEEQILVMNEIVEIADQQQVDLVLIAGDLFDNFNPSVEAVELFYKTLKRFSNNGKRPVIAISGNHDSPSLIDAPDPLARECGIILIGYPNAKIQEFELNDFKISKSVEGMIELKLNSFDFPIRIIHTPYANEIRLKQYFGENKEEALNEVLATNWKNIANEYCDENGVNLLMAHLYMNQKGAEILEEPEGEKPIKIGNADMIFSEAIPPQIQYTALGHLHGFKNIGTEIKPVVYSSSPLCYSFSEAGQTKYVSIIEAEPNQTISYHKVELKNILLNDIKKEYPFVFELAIYFTKRTEEIFNCAISENEIGFIAMHLGIGLESQKLSNRYKAILIHPYDNKVKDQLITFLTTKFSSQIELVNSISYIDEIKINEENPDIILSTTQLNVDFTYILISPFGLTKDEIKIINYLNELNIIKLQKDNHMILKDFFSRDLFYMDMEFDNSEDIIRFLSDKLLEQGIVSNNFYKSVLDRESISPTSFEQFIAVPHPIVFDSFSSKGAVCILKRPIQWGEYQVKIVILFAIKNEDRKKLKDYYSLIGQAIIEENSLRRLLAAKSYSQFLDVFSA